MTKGCGSEQNMWPSQILVHSIKLRVQTFDVKWIKFFEEIDDYCSKFRKHRTLRFKNTEKDKNKRGETVYSPTTQKEQLSAF